MGKNRRGSIIDSFSMIASKIGNQRHLAANRDGFITLMPPLIVALLS